MKRFSEQLQKKAGTVKLRAAEKRALRERVVSYMEYHPLPKEVAEKKPKMPAVETDTYRIIHIPFTMVARAVAGMAVLLLVIVPVLAERSVPGDNLYAVKVKFNEEVRSSLTFSTSQKVAWETERLNRRIAEARLLANEGRLTEEVEAEVADAVRTHSENARKNIEELRSEDADEATLASIALETTLEVQSASFKEEEPVSEDGAAVAMMMASEAASSEPAEKSNTLANAIEESRAMSNASNASSTIPAFDKIMAKVELNTTRIYELLDTLEENASEAEVAEVTRRIEDIERVVTEAGVLREEEDQTARKLLVEALQRTQKLIVFMTDIQVTATVDINELVPVDLTLEEEAQQTEQYIEEIEADLEDISEKIELIEDEIVVEKIQFAHDQAGQLLLQLASTTDFTTTEQLAREALSYTDDAKALIESTLTVLPEPITVPPATTTEASSSPQSAATTTASTTPPVTPPATTSTTTKIDTE